MLIRRHHEESQSGETMKKRVRTDHVEIYRRNHGESQKRPRRKLVRRDHEERQERR
jgi:hypothetical protein